MSYYKKTICPDLLEGCCFKGKKCRFRHQGEGRPSATVYACEVIGVENLPASNNAQLTLPEGAHSALLLHGAEAVFSAGAVPLSIKLPSPSTTTSRIASVQTVLEVTWYLPRMTVWLQYDHRYHAEIALVFLDARVDQGDGVTCTLQPSNSGMIWSVRIKGLDPSPRYGLDSSVHVDNLVNSLGAHLQPTRVVTGKPSYVQQASIADVIHNKLSEFTRFTSCKIETNFVGPGAKQKERVILEGAPSLANLAERLNNTSVPKLGSTKIYAQELITIDAIMDFGSYAAIAGTFKKLAARIWKVYKVKVSIAPITYKWKECYDPVSFVLRSNDRQKLKRAKSEIDYLLKNNTKAHRSNLASPKQTHRIRLTRPHMQSSALNGGFDRILETFGKDAATLDQASDPPAIVVFGDSAQLRRVQKILRTWTQSSPSSDRSCPICFDDEECLVTVAKCGHGACKQCFIEYCTTPRQGRFPLRCFQCDDLLQMAQLRSTLPKSMFDSLLQQAAEEYLNSRLQLYIKCPYDGCKRYYEVATLQKPHTCDSCLGQFCPDCKIEYHDGETCQEYRYRVSGAQKAMDDWMLSNGAKKCRNCETVLQKTVGCDHIQCGNCQAHMCFKCMEIFDSAPSVYKHLSDTRDAVHDGTFGGDALDFDGLDLAEQRAWLAEIEAMRALPGGGGGLQQDIGWG